MKFSSDPISFVCLDKEYVNIKFSAGELVHGKRYIVCIHAPKTNIQQETWLETLPETNVCSDGVVVDLTPPKAGLVYMGNIPGNLYQVFVSTLLVEMFSFELKNLLILVYFINII